MSRIRVRWGAVVSWVAAAVAGQPESAGREVRCATGVALGSLGIYWATLAPGLIGVADTPKFQFIGRVLGVPHSPGYPLYVLASHVFGYLPLGSLAYRINLMSAVFGAVTAGLLYLVLRRLGCRPAVGASIALSSGFGPVLWSASVAAEVYTLHAAIVVGMMLAMLVWRQERRASAFYLAVALFALGLGNHTTVALLAPAWLAYALSVDARWLMHRRRLAITAGLLLLGLTQYGFILLRTWQRAPYLEVSASNLGELIDVIRGERWNSQLFVFDLPTLIVDRVPLLARMLGDELGAVGLALTAVGLLHLGQRHRAEALWLLMGIAATVGFGLSFATPEWPPFFIAPILFLWVLAGVGFDRVWRAAGPRGRAVSMVTLIAVVWLPASQLWLHYGASDRSQDTGEIRFFRALFQQLPSRAVFVTEDYVVDRMIDYKILGERAHGAREVMGPVSGRRVDQLERLWETGFAVYAFPRWTSRLRLEGLRMAPVPLFDAGAEGRGPRVPLADPPRGVFRLRAPRLCRDVSASSWQPYGEITASGKVILRVAHQDTLLLYLGRDTPLSPRVTNISDRATRRLGRRSFGPGPQGRQELETALAQDGLAAGEDLRQADFVYRIAVTLEHEQAIPSAMALALGGSARAAWARAHSTEAAGSSELCAAVVGNNGFFGDPHVRRERLDLRAQELFGYGWREVEQASGGLFRWTTTGRAELLLPLWRAAPLLVQVTARAVAGRDGRRGTLQLRVNETALRPRALRPGWSSYAWEVPRTALRVGLNQAYLVASKLESPRDGPAPSTLGVAVSDLTLALTSSR